MRNDRKILITDVKSCNVNGKSPGHYFTLAQNYKDMFASLAEVQVVGGPIYKSSFPDAVLLPCDEIVSDNIIKRKLSVLKKCFAALGIPKDDYLIFSDFLEKIVNRCILQRCYILEKIKCN